MNDKFSVLVLSLLLTIPVYSANETDPLVAHKLEELVNKLNQYSLYQMSFKQINNNLTTGQITEGQGQLTIQKPNRFDWVYTSTPQNRITCDGNYIVMLMPDTRQAMTEKADAQSIIWSPISILTHASLKNQFRIQDLEKTSSFARYRLFPISKNEPYEYLDITMFPNTSNTLFSLVIIDLAGNSNQLDFGVPTQISDDRLIVFPPIPPDYDVTDFQGNPQDFRFF